jgi:hypothetical protein
MQWIHYTNSNAKGKACNARGLKLIQNCLHSIPLNPLAAMHPMHVCMHATIYFVYKFMIWQHLWSCLLKQK